MKYFTAKNLLLGIGVLSANIAIGQTWTGSAGNLTTTASKVGIGVPVPPEKLTVQDGNIALTNSTFPDASSSTWRWITAMTDYSVFNIGTNPDKVSGLPNGSMLQMFSKNNSWRPGKMYFYTQIDNTGSAGNYITHSFENMKGGGAFTQLMHINDVNGKAVVSIGTLDWVTANTYGLIVERGILTEKVRVAIKGTPEWSDFVFADDYHLMPLKKLEQFIEAENHLPEIPSAEEVVKEGIDVAQMQAKLLQKIEELTLYVIQQQKEIDGLKKKVGTKN